MRSNGPLPFGLIVRDELPFIQRGYRPAPHDAPYDPQTQTVPAFLIREPDADGSDEIFATGVFGDTSPTTASSTYSTGLFNDDTDESADDTGTD
jgi:hypothetical protein